MSRRSAFMSACAALGGAVVTGGLVTGAAEAV
jgi:hypothetical protein